jgi:hypothetical protein
MQIVNSNPDLVKALGTALERLTGIPEDTRIVEWAITLLLEQNTPDAESALDRFADAALRLAGDSPEIQGLRAEGAVIKERRRQR